MIEAQQSYRDYLNRRYFASMDGLRCIAILAVIAFHARITAMGLFGLRGPIGVEFFFVISGFLITTLILRERDKYGTISLRNFYARRVLRIFPVYYAVLTVITFYVIAFEHGPERHEFFRNLPAFISYTANWFLNVASNRRIIFSVAWSLSTEEQFYLFWPSVVSYSSKHRRFPIVLVTTLCVLNLVLQALIDLHKIHLGWVYENMLVTVPAGICYGCMLAYALNDERMFTRLYKLLSPRWMSVLALGCAVGVTYIAALPMQVAGPFWVLCLATTVVQPDHYLRPLLEAKPVKMIGAVSYCMYLMHILVLNMARRILHIESPVLSMAFAVPTVFVIAMLSYRFLEAPFLRYKDRFAKGPRTAEPVMTPPTRSEQISASSLMPPSTSRLPLPS